MILTCIVSTRYDIGSKSVIQKLHGCLDNVGIRFDGIEYINYR